MVEKLPSLLLPLLLSSSSSDRYFFTFFFRIFPKPKPSSLTKMTITNTLSSSSPPFPKPILKTHFHIQTPLYSTSFISQTLKTQTLTTRFPRLPTAIYAKTHIQTPLYNTSFISQTQTLISLKSSNRFSRLPTAIYAKNEDTVDGPDRLISAICYFYPFFDGIQYGKYVINQFTFLQTLISPLVPAIRVFKSFPFNGFLVFLTLYFIVVRNNNFSRYVRFNTMQAIVLDVLLIFPDLIERTFNPKDGVGLDLLMSLDSTVFLFLLVSLIYGTSNCVIGQVPRLPIVADAADRQVM